MPLSYRTPATGLGEHDHAVDDFAVTAKDADVTKRAEGVDFWEVDWNNVDLGAIPKYVPETTDPATLCAAQCAREELDLEEGCGVVRKRVALWLKNQHCPSKIKGIKKARKCKVKAAPRKVKAAKAPAVIQGEEEEKDEEDDDFSLGDVSVSTVDSEEMTRPDPLDPPVTSMNPEVLALVENKARPLRVLEVFLAQEQFDGGDRFPQGFADLICTYIRLAFMGETGFVCGKLGGMDHMWFFLNIGNTGTEGVPNRAQNILFIDFAVGDFSPPALIPYIERLTDMPYNVVTGNRERFQKMGYTFDDRSDETFRACQRRQDYWEELILYSDDWKDVKGYLTHGWRDDGKLGDLGYGVPVPEPPESPSLPESEGEWDEEWEEESL